MLSMQELWVLIPQPKFSIPQTKIPHAMWHIQKIYFLNLKKKISRRMELKCILID